MNTTKPFFLLPQLLSLLLCASVSAEQDPEFTDFKPRPAWQEQAAALPAYPPASGLVEVFLQLADFPYSVFLDPASLQAGDDGVFRYTAILISEAGTRNVMFEGIRCATGEFRTYAIGSAGRFEPTTGSPWRPVRPVGIDRFRQTLERRHLCDESKRVRSVRTALDRLKQRWSHDDNYF